MLLRHCLGLNGISFPYVVPFVSMSLFAEETDAVSPQLVLLYSENEILTWFVKLHDVCLSSVCTSIVPNDMLAVSCDACLESSDAV